MQFILSGVQSSSFILNLKKKEKLYDFAVFPSKIVLESSLHKYNINLATNFIGVFLVYIFVILPIAHQRIPLSMRLYVSGRGKQVN